MKILLWTDGKENRHYWDVTGNRFVSERLVQPELDAAPAPPAQYPTVQTDAGNVTLAQISDLKLRASEYRRWGTETKGIAESLRTKADDHLVSAGAILVAHPTEWPVSTDLQPKIEQARSLSEQIANDEKAAADLRGQEPTMGLFDRIQEAFRLFRVEHDRKVAREHLRSLLISISRSAPLATLTEADAERHAATELESQLSVLETRVADAEQWAGAYQAEIARRRDSVKAMGFDALYEAAVLQASGATTVDSPLILKVGEDAYLSTPATLARYVTTTQYVGGSSGFSFPIGHTGIRYRVGSYRGHAVHQQSLTRLDSGTFVLTNQRVAYVGRTKSTSTPLSNVMHVEVYTDGISIVHEGHENPDFYLIANPKHAVFLMNWVLSRHLA